MTIDELKILLSELRSPPKEMNGVFHSNALDEFTAFIAASPFICGHNIIDHDKVYLEKWMGQEQLSNFQFIDTLFLSALLFPEKPYRRLVKDDKLDPENLNNPYPDATRAKDQFYDEVEEFRQTVPQLQEIYLKLLGGRTTSMYDMKIPIRNRHLMN